MARKLTVLSRSRFIWAQQVGQAAQVVQRASLHDRKLQQVWSRRSLECLSCHQTHAKLVGIVGGKFSRPKCHPPKEKTSMWPVWKHVRKPTCWPNSCSHDKIFFDTKISAEQIPQCRHNFPAGTLSDLTSVWSWVVVWLFFIDCGVDTCEGPFVHHVVSVVFILRPARKSKRARISTIFKDSRDVITQEPSGPQNPHIEIE